MAVISLPTIWYNVDHSPAEALAENLGNLGR